MSREPLPLRMANVLEKCLEAAAKELRRLHKENESLLAANKDSMAHFDALMADHKKSHGAMREDHKGWLDEFGNVFPLGAYTITGKPNWMDAHKRGWTPLYTRPTAQPGQPAPQQAEVERWQTFVAPRGSLADTRCAEFDADMRRDAFGEKT